MSQTVTSDITLSIISHTNIGKTTLVRTLLRRDVGKVLDQAHVTDQNEKFTWLETHDGARLHIWDTPGFGNSVQLLKVLQRQEHPIGWMIAHVWDRFKDRPLWCSQQALKNVRDEADVVLYLVNALEDPSLASGYIQPEMELLDWLQKPVLVVLNQIGSESGTQEREACERDWHNLFKPYAVVQGIVSLDSFSRCWVLEGMLLEHVRELLPSMAQETMGRLTESWKVQNTEVFKKSMNRLAQVLVRAMSDEEVVSETGQLRKVKIKRAAQDLCHRLEQDIRLAMQDLIEWHGLEGEAAIKIQSQLHDVTVPIESSVMEEALGRAALGGFGGAAAGTAAGAAIDAATGGMSLGLFALTGAFLGALGLAAWGKDVEIGEILTIRWVPEFLHTLTQDLLLRYMAVAHFGRGRGNFQDDQASPLVWQEVIRKGYEGEQSAFQQIWEADHERESHDVNERTRILTSRLESVARTVLCELYPASKDIHV
ncbi:GTPase domain-containing protein [Nitrospira sp. M1]